MGTPPSGALSRSTTHTTQNVTPDSPQILHVVVQGQATDGTARTSAGASSSAPTASTAPRAADAVRMQHAGAAAPSAARPPPGTAAPAEPDPESSRRPRPQTAHPAIKGLAEVLHLNAAAVASASMSAAYAAALAVLGHPIPQPLVEGGAGPPAPVHMPQAPQQVLAQVGSVERASGLLGCHLVARLFEFEAGEVQGAACTCERDGEEQAKDHQGAVT